MATIQILDVSLLGCTQGRFAGLSFVRPLSTEQTDKIRPLSKGARLGSMVFGICLLSFKKVEKDKAALAS